MTFKEILVTMRPNQWYKNLLLFVGIVFSRNIFSVPLWFLSVAGFAIFCGLSGAVYILNDVVDRERDAKHPQKSSRPIASGSLSVRLGLVVASFVIVAGLLASYRIGMAFLTVAGAYVTLSLLYDLFFKKMVIVDVMVVAIGFVIRAVAGAVVILVPVSPWLLLCAFLLALFLALGKRRHELLLLGDKANEHRDILSSYSTHILEDMINITTALLIMAYSMYTFFGTTIYMMSTIPFAIFGIFRYLFLIHRRSAGGEPELIFKDVPMVIDFLLWVLVALAALYLAPEESLLFPRWPL